METITCCSRCLWLIVINTCFLCWSEQIISDCSPVERGSPIGRKKPLTFCLIAAKTNAGLLRVPLGPTRLVGETFSHLPFFLCY